MIIGFQTTRTCPSFHPFLFPFLPSFFLSKSQFQQIMSNPYSFLPFSLIYLFSLFLFSFLPSCLHSFVSSFISSFFPPFLIFSPSLVCFIVCCSNTLGAITQGNIHWTKDLQTIMMMSFVMCNLLIRDNTSRIHCCKRIITWSMSGPFLP